MWKRLGINIKNLLFLSYKNLFVYLTANCRPEALRQPCLHGGYQEPKSCSQCKCAPGFGGQYCQQVAQSNGRYLDMKSIIEMYYFSSSFYGQKKVSFGTFFTV